MKKAIPWILTLIAVVLAVWICLRTDAQAAAIVEQGKAKEAALQVKLNETTRRYANIEGTVERLEAELQVKPKEIVRTVIKTVTVQAPSAPAQSPPAEVTETPGPLQPVSMQSDFSFDWKAAYYEYVAKNQDYIVANQALRIEHDKMINDYEEMLSIERETIAKLAALRRPRLVVVIGVGGGISTDGKLYTGFQFTIGIRVDDLFKKKYKRN